MLRCYRVEGGQLIRDEVSETGQVDERAVWIDLVNPSRAEERIVETAVGINVPTREEMQEIELSSRLFEEDGAYFMTAQLVWRSDTGMPETTPVTFVLVGSRLITIRYSDPMPFKTWISKAERQPTACQSAQHVLAGLLEAIIDRLADILEQVGRAVDGVSSEVFHRSGTAKLKNRLLEDALQRIGRHGDATSKVRESLVSLDRLVIFVGTAAQAGPKSELRQRLKTMARDVQSLSYYADSLTNKVIFLLDATLGLINIEQNAIIKIFSVVAVAFLPPTLIASIYGMNFRHMPELDWPYAYPLAILAIVISAILPFWYFNRRGWL